MLTDAHGAKWQANWDLPLNQLNLTGPQVGGAGIGTLTKTAVFLPGVSSMTITFTQLTASAMPDNKPKPNSPGNDFGLRFTLDEIVTNRTGTNWTGFKETLMEVNPVTAKDMTDFPANDPHPWFAHFHSDKFTPNQFKLAGNFPDAGNVLQVGGGLVKGDGGKWTPTGIGIHERIFGDVFPRKFLLIETPQLPEPTSLVLMGLGLAGVLAFARLRRRSAIA
jgi:hypothetical protein